MWVHSLIRISSIGVSLDLLVNKQDLIEGELNITLNKIILGIILAINAAILIGLSYLISFHIYLSKLGVTTYQWILARRNAKNANNASAELHDESKECGYEGVAEEETPSRTLPDENHRLDDRTMANAPLSGGEGHSSTETGAMQSHSRLRSPPDVSILPKDR